MWRRNKAVCDRAFWLEAAGGPLPSLVGVLSVLVFWAAESVFSVLVAASNGAGVGPDSILISLLRWFRFSS